MKDRLPPTNTRWILVDHNRLEGNLGSVYSSRVHGVIDHHMEENAVPQNTEPEPRLIEKSGSCSSLIIHTFRSTWDAISSSSLSSGAAHAQSSDSLTDDSIVTQGWDAQIAKLALGSILDDTSNLKFEGKTMPIDRYVVEYLESKIQTSHKDVRSWNRDNFYKEITTAKKDIEGIALEGILRKDYKQWTENGMKLGISTVVKPLEFIVEKATTESADGNNPFDRVIQAFMQARDLTSYAIMTTSKNSEGHFQRQLFLQSNAAAIHGMESFASTASEELRLEALDISGIPKESHNTDSKFYRRVWQQKEVSKSRKQVAPMIREAMQ